VLFFSKSIVRNSSPQDHEAYSMCLYSTLFLWKASFLPGGYLELLSSAEFCCWCLVVIRCRPPVTKGSSTKVLNETCENLLGSTALAACEHASGISSVQSSICQSDGTWREFKKCLPIDSSFFDNGYKETGQRMQTKHRPLIYSMNAWYLYMPLLLLGVV